MIALHPEKKQSESRYLLFVQETNIHKPRRYRSAGRDEPRFALRSSRVQNNFGFVNLAHDCN